MRGEFIVGADERPGVGSRDVVDADGEDGIGKRGRGGYDSSMQRMQDRSYALERDKLASRPWVIVSIKLTRKTLS